MAVVVAGAAQLAAAMDEPDLHVEVRVPGSPPLAADEIGAGVFLARFSLVSLDSLASLDAQVGGDEPSDAPLEAAPPASGGGIVQTGAAPTTEPPPTTTDPPPTTEPPPTTAAPTEATGDSSIPLDAAAADQFVGEIAALRAAPGVGAAPLARTADLDDRAASWARQMAAAGKLSHSGFVSSSTAAGWAHAGENVGAGWSVSSIHDMFVASSPHYGNMTNPDVRYVGVAVAVDDAGRLWVVQLFLG